MKRIIKYLSLGLLASLGPFLTSCSTPEPKPAPRRTVNIVMKPQVAIKNLSNRSVGIKLTGPQIKYVFIPAHGTRTISLRSGAYRYTAVSKNARSITGYKYFGTNKRYTWRFRRN